LDAFLLSERKRGSETERQRELWIKISSLFFFYSKLSSRDWTGRWTVYKLWQIEPKILGRSLSDVPKSEARESRGKKAKFLQIFIS
jgi:hypothetical protein